MKKFIDFKAMCTGVAAGLTALGIVEAAKAAAKLPKKISEAHAARKTAKADKEEKK